MICEIGPPTDVAESYAVQGPGDPLRLSWSGLHLPGKALPLLLRALAKLPKGLDWRLDILGRGPCTGKWRREAYQLGVDSRCRWRGQLARDRALEIMGDSHLFIITSMKDLTSTVLLEALSRGVPVIVPHHCGFSDVVTEYSGIKVPVTTPRQFVSDLAGAVRRIADDEAERRRLARGAVERVTDFSWEKKAEMVDGIYREVVKRAK